jgi:hypothetical protein
LEVTGLPLHAEIPALLMPKAEGVNLGLKLDSLEGEGLPARSRVRLALELEEHMLPCLAQLHHAAFVHNDIRIFNIMAVFEGAGAESSIKSITVSVAQPRGDCAAPPHISMCSASHHHTADGPGPD